MLTARKIIKFLVDYKLACSLEAANYLYGDTDLSDVAILKNGIVINDFLYNEELRQKVMRESKYSSGGYRFRYCRRMSYEKILNL